MSRDPYRSSTGALPERPGPPVDRWDHDRVDRDRLDRDRLERERMDRERMDRDRIRDRYEVRDEHFAHGALPVRPGSPPASRIPPPPPPPAAASPASAGRGRPYPDDNSDIMDRDRYYPPPRDRDDFSDLVYERDRRYTATRHLSPSPPPVSRAPRPGILRRQSSLDTFDRLPPRFYQREKYPPPARREDVPPPAAYAPAPLPRTHQLPPPDMVPRRDDYEESLSSRRRSAYEELPPLRRGHVDPYEVPLSAPPIRRQFPDDIHIAEAGHYGDDKFHPAQEREYVHEHERRIRHRHRGRSRSRSKDSRTTTTRSRTTTSRSSSTSSRSSSSSGGTTVRNEYPKKGKTRIPARLVSKRVLYDLGYPFEEDGNTVVILLALGQNNIDDVLRLSEDYKKAETEVETAQMLEALPAPATTTIVTAAQPAAPVIIEAPPAPAPVIINATAHRHNVVEFAPAGPPVEVIESRKVTREVSPARTYTTGTSDYTYTTGTSDYTYTTATTNPVDRLLESEHIHVGPLVLAEDRRVSRRKSKSRSRSRSARRGERAIAAQIRELEAERDALRHGHRRHRHRSSSASSGDVVRYHERLSNGDLVVYEEKYDEFSDGDEHHHSHHHHNHSHSRHRSKSRGARIEKDKKGPPPALLRAMLATLT